MFHWQPLCACVFAECSIRFELGSFAVAHISSCAGLNCRGCRCTSLSLDCSWLPCLSVDCRVLVVVVFLQTSCSATPVQFLLLIKAFFDSISVNASEEGSLCCW